MIDAYEVGIQLLIQDNVSAGLAVINGGLAEVDRAIAATSANLVGLTRDAATATKAVAATTTATGRASPSVPSEENSVRTPEQVPPDQLAETSVRLPTEARKEHAIAPQTSAEEAFTPATQPVDASLVKSSDFAQQPAREPKIAPSAPVLLGFGEQASPDQVTSSIPAEFGPTTANSPDQAAVSTKYRADDTAPSTVKKGTALATEFGRNAPSHSRRGGLTASINRAQRLEVPSAPSAQSRNELMTVPAARRDRPAAPWSGVEHFGAQAEPARPQERAAAPQSTGQDRPGAGSGAVILDGRLVGQWLSDHMAQQASRPPAGTSFFDSRQAPAWNVSGLL